jgi:TldD protein
VAAPDLDDAVLRDALSAALGGGADFAELYAETRRSRSLRLDDRKIEDLVSGLDQGVGIRVIAGRRTGYAYTNLLDREALIEAAKVAAAAAVTGAARTTVADLRELEPPVLHPVARDPAEADGAAIADIVRRVDASARDVAADVRQVSVSYADSSQHLLLVNSEGHLSREDRVRTRLVCNVVAARDGVIQTGFFGPGASVGLELLDAYPPEDVGQRAARQAVAMLDADPAPAGEMTVVLAPGSGGVLFHEACGHGMEADIVAKGASVYKDKRGRRMAINDFNGVDDATVVGAWGSFGFDDEGTPAQRTMLFQDGVCTDYMSDRLRAAELDIPRSGNARRQSYAHLPIPRMTNSYILSGRDDPDEIVRTVERGLYCASLGGGQVDPASGDFVFGVTEAYLIEHGEITRGVRGANLVGDGPTVLDRIEALGTDFGTREGVCGKDGQGVPAGLGNPTLRIGRITIGGTA